MLTNSPRITYHTENAEYNTHMDAFRAEFLQTKGKRGAQKRKKWFSKDIVKAFPRTHGSAFKFAPLSSKSASTLVREGAFTYARYGTWRRNSNIHGYKVEGYCLTIACARRPQRQSRNVSFLRSFAKWRYRLCRR